MPTQIKFKRGSSTNFTPITLDSGEPAFVTDTGKLYIGDGTNKVLINPIDKPSSLDTIDAYTKIKVNEYGQVVSLDNLVAADIPAIPSTQVTGLGTAAVLNVGTASGNIPVLDGSGKLNASTLPPIAITNTFVVASQDEMLALTADIGDIAVRSDLQQTFILKDSPASTLSNWVELATPTDSVLSVNGEVGAVTLDANDMVVTGYVKATLYSPVVATDTTTQAVGKLEKNFDNFAPINSPIFTGTPASTTPTAGDSSANIATTAFVSGAISTATAPLAPINSPTFTGSPKAVTTASTDNSTNIATTAFVQTVFGTIDGGTF